MSDDEPDVRPEDALQVAQRALQKANELEQENRELKDELADHRDRLTSLELRYSEFDEDRSYEDLDRDGRVGRVREHAYQRATEGHGRTTLDYNDVMWSVFDGEPSADYSYKLMRLAARAPGFTFKNPDGKGKKLLVDAEKARRGASFSSANKTSSEEVR